MDRKTELELLEELAGLRVSRSFYLDESVTTSPVARYSCPDQFDRERGALFRSMPAIVAHGSELDGLNSFITREYVNMPLLLTRDGNGKVHTLLNVCRHRGSRLVNEDSGCSRRFVCPYHAWTYDNRGVLKVIPHGESGFPGISRDSLGLKQLGCQEAFGWVWINPGSADAPNVEGFLDGLAPDMAWLDAGNVKIVHQDIVERAANWKILYEGGLEAYHFRIAHKDTIGKYFQDNLSSYRMFGRHIRSILPRSDLDSEMELPEESRSLRSAANILYTILPSAQLLAQKDHISWLQVEPLAVDRSRLRISTLAPVDSDFSNPDTAHYWRKNHEITMRTLAEDFDIGESIQSGLLSGANEYFQFGRYEGALDKFDSLVDAELAGS